MALSDGVWGNIAGALGQYQQSARDYERQVAAMRNLYASGVTTSNSAVITFNPQSYTIEANYAPATRTAPKGAFRRTVREGEIRYSDSPMKWLDERVEEMQFVL